MDDQPRDQGEAMTGTPGEARRLRLIRIRHQRLLREAASAEMMVARQAEAELEADEGDDQ